jgi:hypothetical protein
MRIVIWNCNMALHDKYEHLLALAPDIAVIPQCANINVMQEKAPKFSPIARQLENMHKPSGWRCAAQMATRRPHTALLHDQDPKWTSPPGAYPAKIDLSAGSR